MKYSAQVVNSRNYTFDDIAKHLVERNTGLSSSAIYGLWEGIKDAVEEFISEGGSIKTELFNARAGIKGIFNGMEDGFDSGRHEIRLNLRPGILLRDIPKKLKVKKLKPGVKSSILSVLDIKSGSINNSLTPGKSIRIIGQRIKIDGADPSCGIYFVPAKDTEQPVKVDFSDVAVNNPSQIIALVPRLNKGIWHIKLITQFSYGKCSLKAPKTITFEKSLTVA